MDVTGITSSVTVTETAATLNITRGVTCATETITLAELTGSIAFKGYGTVSTVFSGLGATAVTVNTSSFLIRSTAIATESIASVFDFDIHDTVIAGDSTEATFEQLLTGVVNASASTTEENYSFLDGGTVQAGNVIGPVIWDANISPSAFSSSITTEYGLAESLTATVNASEITAGEWNAVLDSGVTAQEVLTASTLAANTVVTTVEARDEAIPIVLENLSTTANVTDTFTDTASPQQSITTAILFDSTPTYTVFQNSTLVAIASVVDTWILSSAIHNATLSDNVVLASEELWAADFAAIAWVMNLATGGLSTYDNFGYGSVAAHDGVLYATSPAGVFALSGDKDQSRNITSRVKTGMLDFGIKSKKRIPDIFVGYTGGSLLYEVETYDGPQAVYTYQMPERSADAPRNNRVKPGRGLSSRYWRFTITNVDGADFQLHDQTAVVAASQRRI